MLFQTIRITTIKHHSSDCLALKWVKIYTVYIFKISRPFSHPEKIWAFLGTQCSHSHSSHTGKLPSTTAQEKQPSIGTPDTNSVSMPEQIEYVDGDSKVWNQARGNQQPLGHKTWCLDTTGKHYKLRSLVNFARALSVSFVVLPECLPLRLISHRLVEANSYERKL